MTLLYEWRVRPDPTKHRRRPAHLMTSRMSRLMSGGKYWSSKCGTQPDTPYSEEDDPTVPMPTGHRTCKRCTVGMR